MGIVDLGFDMNISINKSGKHTIVKRAGDAPSVRNAGGRLLRFVNPPRIIGRHAIVSNKEKQGPLGEYFSDVMECAILKEKSFEKAEVEMFAKAVDGAMAMAGVTPDSIDLLLGGDLLNQITSASYTARYYNIPFLGLYNACATMTEALIVGSAMLDAGFVDLAMCVTGSHFATAERLYRGPLELGLQRQRYSQHTVTGAGATLLGMTDKGIKITAALIGVVEDYGLTDVANMGAGMAPSAMSSFTRFFKASDTKPEDYDLIVSGDLGKIGSDLLRMLMEEQGYPLGRNYMDCGACIYDQTQHSSSGGSGAGCSASVLNTYIIDKMEEGMYKKVLVGATGALMSLTTSQQGETMPAVTHVVLLEAE